MHVPFPPTDFVDNRPASAFDSGFGNGTFANNGAGSSSNGAGGHTSSEGSHEAGMGCTLPSPHRMSSNSSPTSVREEEIEVVVNPRAQMAPRVRGDDHLSELSELDRKIALKNLEIATLMLNDSHSRSDANREHRFSESEAESAHEEQIQPTPREQLFPESGGRKIGLEAEGFENFAFEAELGASDGVTRVARAKVNSGYSSGETDA